MKVKKTDENGAVLMVMLILVAISVVATLQSGLFKAAGKAVKDYSNEQNELNNNYSNVQNELNDNYSNTQNELNNKSVNVDGKIYNSPKEYTDYIIGE